jgi:hypothetical protein
MAGWYVVNRLELARSRRDRLLEIRTQYMIAAYRDLNASLGGLVTSANMKQLEHAIVDVQLLGTNEVVRLAKEYVETWGGRSLDGIDVSALTHSMRATIREDLGLDADPEDAKLLRIHLTEEGLQREAWEDEKNSRRREERFDALTRAVLSLFQVLNKGLSSKELVQNFSTAVNDVILFGNQPQAAAAQHLAGMLNASMSAEDFATAVMDLAASLVQEVRDELNLPPLESSLQLVNISWREEDSATAEAH